MREIVNEELNADEAPLSPGDRAESSGRSPTTSSATGRSNRCCGTTTVSDILVNGPDQVYVEGSGKLELTDVRFNDDQHLMLIIDRIVSQVGRRVDEASPMVDARLADGVASTRSSRRWRSTARRSRSGVSAEALHGGRSDREGDGYRRHGRVPAGNRHGRLNVLVSGGTGSGKTTMLNACRRSSRRTSAS